MGISKQSWDFFRRKKRGVQSPVADATAGPDAKDDTPVCHPPQPKVAECAVTGGGKDNGLGNSHYCSFSYTTRGGSHKKENLVCQDASLHYDDTAMSVAVVADGHGSENSFRSDIGSRVATEVALAGIKEFIQKTSSRPKQSLTDDPNKLLKDLAENFITEWFKGVEKDEAQKPLKDDERLHRKDDNGDYRIKDKYRDRYLNDPDHQYFCRAYGTTLIAVAVTEYGWFGLHIGDGKCVALFDDGRWEQPITWDDKCFLNETTSICDSGAINGFRVHWGDGRKPVAIFIGSDGVDDTYPVHNNEKHLASLYRSVVLAFAKDGFDNTVEQIKGLAERLADKGSRDDVSIAGIIAKKIPPQLVEILTAQDKAEKVKEPEPVDVPEQVKEPEQADEVKKEEETEEKGVTG